MFNNKLTQKTTFLCAMLVALAGCCNKKASISSTSDLNAPISDSLNQQFESEAGNRVYFSYNKASLSKDAKATLDKQNEWFKKHGELKATVEGHCDERGTREYNLALGEKRADSVKKYLINIGFNSDKIDTISYGKEKPAAIGTGEEVWHLNRRAVTLPH